jgi:hypothetical protein
MPASNCQLETLCLGESKKMLVDQSGELRAAHSSKAPKASIAKRMSQTSSGGRTQLQEESPNLQRGCLDAYFSRGLVAALPKVA